MTTLFNADQFTATQFDTSAQKAKFANHFVRFVQSGFKRSLFEKWFYQRLSNTFGHIAHYNLDGFYDVQFGSLSAQLAFLRQTQGPIYGDPAFTYSDVERALKSWVSNSGHIDLLGNSIAQQVEKDERDTLARLKAKYEGTTK